MTDYEMVQSLVPYALAFGGERVGALVTAYVTQFLSLSAASVCGVVEGLQHVWLRFGTLNVDFAAGQFVSLAPYVVNVDGAGVVFGDDAYFASIGYVISPSSSCDLLLDNALGSILSGEFGDVMY